MQQPVPYSSSFVVEPHRTFANVRPADGTIVNRISQCCENLRKCPHPCAAGVANLIQEGWNGIKRIEFGIDGFEQVLKNAAPAAKGPNPTSGVTEEQHKAFAALDRAQVWPTSVSAVTLFELAETYLTTIRTDLNSLKQPWTRLPTFGESELKAKGLTLKTLNPVHDLHNKGPSNHAKATAIYEIKTGSTNWPIRSKRCGATLCAPPCIPPPRLHAFTQHGSLSGRHYRELYGVRHRLADVRSATPYTHPIAPLTSMLPAQDVSVRGVGYSHPVWPEPTTAEGVKTGKCAAMMILFRR